MTTKTIAELMIHSTELLDLKIKREGYIDFYNKLYFRIGRGKSTNYSFYKKRDKQRIITYGLKMIESMNKQSKSSNWTHAKEIMNRGYFNKELTFQNLIIAVILHEYAHFMISANGLSTRNSVHNKIFYKHLDWLYENNYDEYLENIMYENDTFKSIETIYDFEEKKKKIDSINNKLSNIKDAIKKNKHEFILFKESKNSKSIKQGLIIRKNSKTISCITPDMLIYKVPYLLVEGSTNQQNNGFEKVNIDNLRMKLSYSQKTLENKKFVEFDYNGTAIKAKIIRRQKKNLIVNCLKENEYTYTIPYTAIDKAY